MLVVACLFCGSASRAQALPASDSSPVSLEIYDVYGDKQTVPLTDGMTLYWPQGVTPQNQGNVYAVLCDKDGKPALSFPVLNQRFALMKFANAPASPVQADMTEYKKPASETSFQLRFDVAGQQYMFPNPGELRFSSPLGSYELVSALGENFTIPLAETAQIVFQDTIQGVGNYLSKLQEGNQVYVWAFYNGVVPSRDMLHENMYAILPEGSNNNFSLLVPSDEAFAKMPDIISFTCARPRVMSICPLEYTNATFPIQTGRILYPYDPVTGEMSDTPYRTSDCSATEIIDRLKRILPSHVILHNRPEDQAAGLYSGNEYFLAIDGSPVRIIREGGKPTAAQGTFQLWNQEAGRTAYTQGNLRFCRQKGNGVIYEIDQVLEATPRSVYSVLSGVELPGDAQNPFSLFFELCDLTNNVFISNGGMTGGDLNFIGGVPFTLYVPTNEAIRQEQLKNGLPTAAEINSLVAQIEDIEDDETGLQMLQSSLNSKLMVVTDFVRAHLQFGLEIADQLPFERSHKTTLVKTGSLATPSLLVKGLGNGQMTVTDECGNTRNILDAHKNIFVREVSCMLDPNGTYQGKITSPTGRTTLNNIVIANQAPGVIHQIDGVLQYKH